MQQVAEVRIAVLEKTNEVLLKDKAKLLKALKEKGISAAVYAYGVCSSMFCVAVDVSQCGNSGAFDARQDLCVVECPSVPAKASKKGLDSPPSSVQAAILACE